MNWIQFLDKHADGVWCLALAVIIAVTICVVAMAMTIAEFAHRKAQ